jgi:hypothetical protein
VLSAIGALLPLPSTATVSMGAGLNLVRIAKTIFPTTYSNGINAIIKIILNIRFIEFVFIENKRKFS